MRTKSWCQQKQHRRGEATIYQYQSSNTSRSSRVHLSHKTATRTKSFSDASRLRKAHLSHGATAGVEAFAMTRGTAVALDMTVETVVMIQADNTEELVVTVTAMVVVGTRTVS